MSVAAQLFSATHPDAVARAAALEAGQQTAPGRHLGLAALGASDLEQLGEIAAKAVRFGAGDLELAEVDLDHETLLQLPDFLCEVLAALAVHEDPDLLGEVAEEWAATDDLAIPEGDLTPVLREIVDLVGAALDDDLDVFLWTEAT